MTLLFWMAALSLMWFGWGAIGTGIGLPTVFVGTTMAVTLLLQTRTPRNLATFIVVTSVGYLAVFAWYPWLLALPAAGLAGAGWWWWIGGGDPADE